LHPRIAQQLELTGDVVLFELDIGQLAKKANLAPGYRPLPRYPAVFRDLAVVVSSDLSSDAVRSIILYVGGEIVEEATVFDVYTGKPIPEGRKNLAFAIKYRAQDRTLTDAEVNVAHERIVSEVNSKVGGSLRGVDT
jgi:phenylalanyl-tRNA synthetase beta chain